MYVKINNIKFKYKNSKDYALNDFSFDLNKGEILSILGESGSGKSTMLRIIAGLEYPNAGAITIDGVTIVDDKQFTLPEKRGIGMVFQDYALFPHMTVENNIKFGLFRSNRQEQSKKVKEMLALVNLEGYAKRYPHELSGGQQQRVALARALAPGPSLLLLDEPFSNLDKDLQVKIRSELKDILKKAGITSIFVTHDRDDASALADSVVVLKDGRILNCGSAVEVLNDGNRRS